MLSSCNEPKADITSPKTHQTGDITFSYPGNWKITEDWDMTELQSFIIETPGDAIVIYQAFPIDEADKLEAYVENFSNLSEEEIAIGSVSKPTFTRLPDTAGFTWIKEEFEIRLLGESLPHSRLYGTKTIADRQAFIIFQVAEENYKQVLPGFQLIRDSIKIANR